MSELATEPVPARLEDTDPEDRAWRSRVIDSLLIARIRAAAPWVLGTLAVLVLFDVAAVHAVAGSADNATVLLEGQSMSHGNVALSGWSLSLDSFWTVDVLFYAAAVALTGLHPGLLFFVPALLASLVVVAAVQLARREFSGRRAVAAAVTVIGLLALPGPDLAYYLLQGPWHVGTVLWCLLGFAGLSRGRFGWGWAAATVLFAFGLLGDLLIVAFGIVPSMAAGVVAMIRTRRLRAGAAPLSAGLLSVGLAAAIRGLAELSGTFTLVNRNIVVRLPRVAANVGHLPNRVDAMLGVGSMPFKHMRNGALVLQGFHVVGLAIFCAGVLGALVALVIGMTRGRPVGPQTAETWRMDDLLLFGVLGDLVLFVWGSPSGNLDYVKYLTAAVVFGVILSGRLVGYVAVRFRARLLMFAAAVAVVVLAAFAVEFGQELFHPVPEQPTAALGAFLASHGLHVGVGDYWSSSLVTVETDGAVAVRPVETRSIDQIIRFDRQSSVDWYRGQRFQFLVYDTSQPWHGVNSASAIATFGRPTASYSFGTYRVLTWRAGISVNPGPANSGSPLQLFFK